MTRARARGARGTTLLEVMVAGTLLLVAMLGFVATMNDAARATSVGHRRTVVTQIRTELLDGLLVTLRDRFATRPASTWLIDRCYDASAQPTGSNATFDTAYACPDGSLYRSWVRVDPSTTRTWAVHAYVERIDPGCTVAQRYSSIACAAADVLLTD